MQSLLYRKDELSASQLFKELKYLIDSLPEWKEKGNSWLIAHPSKKVVAFNKSNVTDAALAYVDSLINCGDAISIFLADENEDDSIITVLYKNTPAVSSERYVLSITMKSLSNYKNVNDFINIFDQLTMYKGWDFKYILLDTEQYRFNQREVFDDRLPVGWMLYLPIKIKHEDVPSAYNVFHTTNDSGSVIISKIVFNGKDPSDIACANNVEIELAANGLLPLIRKM